MSKRTKGPRRDIQQEVTDTIVKALEAGVAPWVRPWTGGGANGMPRNGATGRYYNGVNVVLLMWAQMFGGYSSCEWMTYKQAQGKGAQVRKNEKGTMVTFWKIIEVQDKDSTDPDAVKKIFLLKHFTVFNVDQIEGLPQVEQVEVTPMARHAAADAMIAATGADISHGGGRACYDPRADAIQLPEPETFTDAGAYYSTALHELGHWTGHGTRLDRPMSGGRGSVAYAEEELVAELASAFMCAEHGLAGSLQHPEYIGHWIAKLKDDKRAIFAAAKQARLASELVTGFGATEEQEDAA